MTAIGKDRVAVVVGGTSGIGLEIVRALLKAGWRVGYLGTSNADLHPLLDDLPIPVPSDMVFGRQVDVRHHDALTAFLGDVTARLGPVSALVYCAGVSPKREGRRVPVHEIRLDEWRDTLEVNLTGALVAAQAVLPEMMRAGFGRIVMIGSMAARTRAQFSGASYVASKSGLAGLARSIANEYGGFGITANTVAPGNIATNMTSDRDPLTQEKAIGRIPTGRIGRPADIGEVVAFLCGDAAGFVNGATIDVTGGELMTP